ncbi:MAG: single-stranded DNA-binding protein [Streptococcaceae bacterium]|jgi:single-strand DNA-binding protein|nr:single-stranded DNA-binding protein [Streptococcaceae bacterium]
MINNVVLVGRLTKDPDLRYTSGGVATASFTLAVNRQFKNQAGEREADFVRCVIWRKAAENFTSWAKRGALIGVTGRIQTGNYDNNQGQRVYTTDVIVENFQMLESKKQNESEQQSEDTFNQSNNFNNQEYQNQTNMNTRDFGNGPIDNLDDNLPFL